MATFIPQRPSSIMQVNLNHAHHAQELLLQYMDERDSGMAVIAEPYRVHTEHPAWAGAPDGSVAITWRRTTNPVLCNREEAGDGYVLVRWGGVLIMGVFLSPRLRLAEVEERLARMERAVRARTPAPIIIMRDFKAHTTMWGSKTTNARGRVLMDWANAMGLCCMNTGTNSTCVRPQGESIVDLTWASPAAAGLIDNWRVLVDIETLSDHVHIEMDLHVSAGTSRDRPTKPFRRWSIRKLDKNKMLAALIAKTWPEVGEERTLEEDLREIMRAIVEACDVAMPRQRPQARRSTC